MPESKIKKDWSWLVKNSLQRSFVCLFANQPNVLSWILWFLWLKPIGYGKGNYYKPKLIDAVGQITISFMVCLKTKFPNKILNKIKIEFSLGQTINWFYTINFFAEFWDGDAVFWA